MKTLRIAALLLLAFQLFSVSAFSADRITATVTITNAPTTNHMSFIVNADTRLWTNAVGNTATQILTNDTVNGIATNLYNHLVATPPANVTVYQTAAAVLRLDARTGSPLVVGGFTNYFSVTYSTQTVASANDVIVPYTAYPSSGRQTITEGLVAWLGLASGTAIPDTAAGVSNLLGRARTQYVPATLYLTNPASQFHGSVSNSPAISGNVDTFTNGVWRNGFLSSPTLTNGANYGDAFRSPGSGSDSEQFGALATATADSAVALGNSAQATDDNAVAIGKGAIGDGADAISIGRETTAVGVGSTAVGTGAIIPVDAPYGVALGDSATVGSGHTNSVAIGEASATTKKNQVMLGNANHVISIAGYAEFIRFLGTNTFPAGSDISFGRYPITSLANGNNAAVPVGTNVFIEVSGPSAAFNLNGINGAPNRDGKLLVILNQTGFNMTIAHDSGTDPTAGNRIYSMTGADRTTTGNGSATLIYSGAASRWILLALDP